MILESGKLKVNGKIFYNQEGMNVLYNMFEKLHHVPVYVERAKVIINSSILQKKCDCDLFERG